MSFKKEDLLKMAAEVRSGGVTVSSMKDLEKKASDLRIAYLIATIKR